MGRQTDEFRVLAWGVAREALRPHTAFTALFAGACALAAVALCSVLLGYLAELGGPTVGAICAAVWLPAVCVCVSPIFARYVLGAQAGDRAAGFFGAVTSGETLSYAARYGALVAVWAPLHAGVFVLVLSGGAKVDEAAALLLVGTTVAGVAWQLPCALVAAHASSVREVFSRESWRWLLVERLGDLPLLAAVLLGVGAALWAVYGLLLGACVFAASALFLGASIGGLGGTSATGLAVLTGVCACVPFGAVLVLTGRLVGAFTVDDHPGDEPRLVDVGPVVEPGIASLAAIRALGATDLAAAIAAAEQARAARPRDAQLASELARMRRRAGPHDEARAAGAEALALAVDGGEHALALELYDTLRTEREALGLDASVLERLGRVLLDRGKLDDATWCALVLSRGGGHALRAQKLLIAVADAAAAAGATEHARRVYELLLHEHPDTAFADYVRRSLDRLR